MFPQFWGSEMQIFQKICDIRWICIVLEGTEKSWNGGLRELSEGHEKEVLREEHTRIPFSVE